MAGIRQWGHMDWSLLGQLSVSVITGSVAAFIAARLALKRFYQERWWEKKLAGYVDLLEAVHHVRATLIAHIHQNMIPPEAREMLGRNGSARSLDFIRVIDLGELLFSRQAQAAITKLLQAQQALLSEPQASPKAYINLLNEFQSEIVAAARKDLRVT